MKDEAGPQSGGRRWRGGDTANSLSTKTRTAVTRGTLRRHHADAAFRAHVTVVETCFLPYRLRFPTGSRIAAAQKPGACAFVRPAVFYPEIPGGRSGAWLVFDIDLVGLVNGRSGLGESTLDQYVNDRPYVSSSFLSALFEPLGSSIAARRYPLDERFPEWGESFYSRP